MQPLVVPSVTINMAPLTGFRSAAPLPGCTSLSVGAGLDPLASVKGAKLEKLVALDCQSALQASLDP